MTEFLSAAFGAFLGLLAGLALEWWKSDRREVSELCEGFCELIAAAADAGAQFWLTSPNDPNCAFLSARIVGFQNRISGYNTILIGRLTADSIDDIDRALGRFFQSLTGGDPDDPARQISKERALLLHDRASAAIIAVRRASFDRLSFSRAIGRWLQVPFQANSGPMLPRPDEPFRGDESRLPSDRSRH